MAQVWDIRDPACPPDAVYIGRRVGKRPASIWANPFRVARHTEAAHLAAIGLYIAYISQRPDLVAVLPTLHGKDLACWCKQDGLPCHGDWLLALHLNCDCKLAGDLYRTKGDP